jgi:hypothetical protein
LNGLQYDRPYGAWPLYHRYGGTGFVTPGKGNRLVHVTPSKNRVSTGWHIYNTATFAYQQKTIQMIKRSCWALLAVYMAACTPFKEINTFAQTSAATLQTIGGSGFTHSGSYINTQTIAPYFNLDTNEINANRFTLPKVVLDSATLKDAQDADGVIALFANSLQTYLGGIAKLSGEDLVNYDFSSVGESLKGNAAALAKVNATGDDIDAALKIAKVATDALMGRYREKKLRSVIVSYDPAFRRTAERLFTALRLLRNTLNSNMGNLEARYNPLLLNEKLPMASKLQWRKDYFAEMNELQKKKLAISELMAAVQKIQTGHSDLAKQLTTSKLTAKAVKDLLQAYSGQIRTAFSSIKQLIN